MRRKLIQLAGKTLVISLPSVWARKHGLEKGEEIEVSERGRSLVVEPTKPDRGSTAKVDVSGLNASLVWHAIVSRYIMGFAEIEVSFTQGNISDPRSGSTVAVEQAIERTLEVMIGMEIIRNTKRTITIREVSSTTAEEYPALLRKVWLMVLTLIEDGTAGLEKNDQAAFKNALRLERNINRLSLYALRMLHMGVAPEVSNALVEGRMLQALEIMGDALAALEKVKPSPALLKQLKLVAAFLRLAYECWFAFSNESYERVYATLISIRAFRSTDSSFLVSASELIVESLAGKSAM